MTTRRIRLLLSLLALTIVPAPAAAQIDLNNLPRLPVAISLELGFAVFDPRHTINAAPLFFTPGVEARSRGRVFAFAGVRAFVPAFPISGSGGDDVVDEDGNPGFRSTGGMEVPWVRAGAGVALGSTPRSATVTVAGGSLGIGGGAHPWVGVAAAVPLRGRWRLEAEVGADRNWVRDRFFTVDENAAPAPLYTRESEEWFRTVQVGVRWGL